MFQVKINLIIEVSKSDIKRRVHSEWQNGVWFLIYYNDQLTKMNKYVPYFLKVCQVLYIL